MQEDSIPTRAFLIPPIEFGVKSDEDIANLGDRVITIWVSLYPRSVEWLFPLSPDERSQALEIWWQERFDHIKATLPLKKIKVSRRPAAREKSFTCNLTGIHLLTLLFQPGVSMVSIHGIEGIKRRKFRPLKSLTWYAVHARFAIQIEDQTTGMQEYEDRMIVVKATSFEAAAEKAKKEFLEYGEPYLNGNCYLVRWHFERILDIYSTWETKFDPDSTEVYSIIKQRRIRPEYEWHPRQELSEGQPAPAEAQLSTKGDK